MMIQGRVEGFSQVHKHMHLCINVYSHFKVCNTVQPAEPLLAKAAFDITKCNQLDHAAKLLEVLQGLNLDKGD